MARVWIGGEVSNYRFKTNKKRVVVGFYSYHFHNFWCTGEAVRLAVFSARPVGGATLKWLINLVGRGGRYQPFAIKYPCYRSLR